MLSMFCVSTLKRTAGSVITRIVPCLKVIIVLLVLVFCILFYLIPSRRYMEPAKASDGRSCKLHKLDPWDKTLRHFLVDPPPNKCKGASSLMFVDEGGYVQWNKSAISQYSLTSLTCAYHVIERVEGDCKIKIEKGIHFEPPIFIKSRIFRVSCVDSNSRTVYDFVHTNMEYNESDTREQEIGDETDKQLSVIYFGLDSASRSHALRKLPLSYKYLTETLGAYDFKGYMKVGMNSFPNLMPLLSGESSATFRKANILLSYLDDLPFIWKDFVKANYVTHQSEDRPNIATFNFVKGGFRYPPVDYYYRPYSLAMDQIEPVIMDPLGKSTWHCYGNKKHFLLQIDNLKRFITKYTNRRKFSFFWNNQEGHEDFLSLGRADQPLYEFLVWMKTKGHLNRTVLIVGSDHGFRLGGASTTYIGRLENNMPFLSVYIPEVLKSKYHWISENLKYNSDRLVSPYDVYATMKDVINKNYIKLNPQPTGDSIKRSLFQKIPEDRTCLDAGIPAQYCSCYDTTPVDTSLPLLEKIALYTISNFNYMLQPYSTQCAKLSLINITDAKVMNIAVGDDDNEVIRDPGFFDRMKGVEHDDSGRYLIMFYTSPNQGLFEVMVDFKRHSRGADFENKITIMGDPVRTNKYGNQSHCINDSLLKQYCLCPDIKVNL